MTRIQLQPGYLLHTRPYGDSSLLVDLLSRDYGRISLLAKGQRQNNKQRKPLHPFSELFVSWSGKSDLKTLLDAEIKSPQIPLKGKALFCGFYINELLVRLLPQMESCPEVFEDYQQFVIAISAVTADDLSLIEPVLRDFEFRLLDALGYGINFYSAADSGDPLVADCFYRFSSDAGFFPVNAGDQRSGYFLGGDLQAIADRDFSLESTRAAAKRLSRLALASHLGDKPLKSRELFK